MKDIKETNTNEMDTTEMTNVEEAIKEINNIDDTTQEISNNDINVKGTDNIDEVTSEEKEKKETKGKKVDNKKGGLLKKILIVWAIIGVILFLSYYGNNKIDITKYTYSSNKVVKERIRFFLIYPTFNMVFISL